MQKPERSLFVGELKMRWKRRVSIPVPRACEARALPIELRSLICPIRQSNSPYSPAGPCSGPLAQAARTSTLHRALVVASVCTASLSATAAAAAAQAAAALGTVTWRASF